MAFRHQTRLLHPLPPLYPCHAFSSAPASRVVYTGAGRDSLAASAFVTTAISILRSHRSRSRWNYLKSLVPSDGISPAEALAIIVQLRNNPRLALRFFLWSRDLELCRHDLSSFSAIVHVLARSRLRPAALSLLRAAVRSHPNATPSSILQTLARTYRLCDSAPFVFDLLIQAYLHSHHLGLALSVLNTLRSRGIHPLASTSNSLLRATARLRGSDAALNLYHDIVQTSRPSSQTFNVLILAMYRDGRTESMSEILSDMARYGCDPNAFTYSILMAGHCDNGNLIGARDLWEEMVGKGINPDTTAYNTLIKGYCEAGEAEMAEKLYREMVLGGVEATRTTFELLIKGHCRTGGNVEAAMLVYRDMRRMGFALEAEVVDELLDQVCKKGMVDEGLNILRGEMRREGVSTGRRRSYEVLIKGLCDAGRMEEAVKLQLEMAGRGFDADDGVYGEFIRGFERLGESEMAEKLHREMMYIKVGGEVSCPRMS